MLAIDTSLWRPSTGSQPAKINCGDEGWLTVKEIAKRTNLTKAGVHQRLRKMRKVKDFDIEVLLEPRKVKIPLNKKQPPRIRTKVEHPPGMLLDAYLEGVASHPEPNCPYKAESLPQSHQDRSQSPMALWSSWWAGWNDTDRGLVD